VRDAARVWGNGPAELLIDRFPMNSYSRSVGARGEGIGAWYDVAAISANEGTRTLMHFRWVFSFFSLILDFIYMTEIRTMKCKFLSLFPGSYTEQVRFNFIPCSIINGNTILYVPST
jgi:hypothetical protein